MHPLFIWTRGGSRTHLNAGVRWTPAATSSKTGCFLYFLSSPRGKKMHIDSRILLPKNSTRIHLNPAVRWTPAATSSKTGCFLYFLSSPGGAHCHGRNAFCADAPAHSIAASSAAGKAAQPPRQAQRHTPAHTRYGGKCPQNPLPALPAPYRPHAQREGHRQSF